MLNSEKDFVERLKKGSDRTRKKGQCRKRTVRPPEMIEGVKQYVTDNSASKSFVKRSIQKTAQRRIREMKSLRRVHATRLSQRQKDVRVQFQGDYIDAANRSKVYVRSTFSGDENIFTAGGAERKKTLRMTGCGRQLVCGKKMWTAINW